MDDATFFNPPRNRPSAEIAGSVPLFRSFWMGGYEGADHLNSSNRALSMNEVNQHWARLDEDYALLAEFGIRTIRESIGWRIAESRGTAGMEALYRQAQLAESHGIEVIWTLMHYGWPTDVELISPVFVDRFGDFAAKVASTLRAAAGGLGQRFYQPVNEISFMSWALSGTTLIRHPLNSALLANGDAVKHQLVRAAIRACQQIAQADPGARFMHSDPVMYVATPPGASELLAEQAHQAHEKAFTAWDLLSGRAEPQLGGSPEYLDILGLNYYHDNQYEWGTGKQLQWHLGDPRRKPFHLLVEDIWQRYQRPMMVAETSHVGQGRGQWLDHMAQEVLLCRQAGMPLEGICLFPALDRPSWDSETHWHNSGLWDIDAIRPGGVAGSFNRSLCQPYGKRLRYWQRRLPHDHAATALGALAVSQDAAVPADTGEADSGHPPANTYPTHLFLNFPGEPVVPTILVFSHLRWNFVYQRPQHLLSRLGGHYRIVFMEEPMMGAEHDHLEQLSPAPDVEVLRPHLRGQVGGFHDDHLPILKSQLADFMQTSGIDDYYVWFYTPMALPLASDLTPRGTIYDCMDELAAFKNAPRQLVQRENALYQQADLVLTGGPSLYRSKKERHANVHCFSSSVDARHFAPSADRPADHPAQSSLAQPRIGYCGVIDERIDIPLIAALADAHPEWQIVMVGPVVKINPDDLPQRPNIHWLGQRAYEDLPLFMAGWDVCVLPFALNESTEFISPTKTLEYMAAGRSAVSTRIRDVAEPYGHVVEIADSQEQFVAACELLLAETAEQQAARAAQMQTIVAATSWDATASGIRALIEKLPNKAPTKKALRADAANSQALDGGSLSGLLRPEHGRQLGSQGRGSVALGESSAGLAAA